MIATVKMTAKIQSNPFKSFYMPERIIADINYPNYSINDIEPRKVRFLLSPKQNNKESYILIVMAQPSISPLQYSDETFDLIKAFLQYYDIKFEDVEIVLDYTQRTGKEEKNLSKWIFSTDHKGDYLDSTIDCIQESENEEIENIRSKYYSDFNIKVTTI
ncbi:hypothetical protein MXL46_14055 [Heyndrickxia sporothermodurans]|uniref:hypothetical protein n=1 Tax=Heyndrickxia sporothermodurans TaxID=46224 RepID=UPI002DBDBA7C|nr:hypothetical protein [Heyndrickxia sporothermodurans]MEB6550215.1 hypothetical protein [Heyndrickxia sporothermodurans]